MGYKTKVQLIKRSNSKQYYVTIPTALAEGIEIKKGEEVEWVINIRTKGNLILKRSSLKNVDKL